MRRLRPPRLSALLPSHRRRLHTTPAAFHGGGHGDSLQDSLAGDQLARANRITWIGMGANFALSFAKIGIGKTTGSAALVADGGHSLSDAVSDIVALGSLKLSRRPADEAHPYGYGSYETVGTLGLAGALM